MKPPNCLQEEYFGLYGYYDSKHQFYIATQLLDAKYKQFIVKHFSLHN